MSHETDAGNQHDDHLVEVEPGVFEIRNQIPIQEDLSPYVGEWVILRNGRVLLHGHDLGKLCDDPAYQEGDMIYPVPPDGLKFYQVA